MGMYYLRALVRNQGDDPIFRLKYRKKASLLAVLVIASMMFFVPIQPAKAWFIGYASPDGSAISLISLYIDSVVNGTIYYHPESYMANDTAISPVPVEVGDNVTLAVGVWLNGTATGISSSEEGKAIIRHRVTVSTAYNSSVFSQQNFTFIVDTGESNAPMYYYRYDVILDFTFVAGSIYTVTITYEIFQE